MSEPPILNCPVYLNYLTPELGAQYEIMRNVHIVTLGAYIWDMLSSTGQEVKMVRVSRITLSMLAYWLARTLTLVVLVLSVLFRTGPIDDCEGHLQAISTISVIAVAASTLLFLKRVQAVFFENKAVWWSIAAVWLANVVAACLAPFGTRANEIADTKHCTITGEPPYLVASTITYLIYDSLVFLVISFKVAMSYTLDRRPSATWKMFFSRPSSSCLCQSILRGGQQYYLVSVCANVVATLLFFLPAVPDTYRTVLMFPSMVLTNSMACRVFRDLFLKNIQPEGGNKHDTAILTTLVEYQTRAESRETKTNVTCGGPGLPSIV